MALTTMTQPPTEVPVPAPAPRRDDRKPSVRDEKREARAYVSDADFSKSLIEANRMQSPGRKAAKIFSLVFHVTFLSVLIVSSMWFTNTLDIRAYTQTLIVGPPPPPPPPAPAVVKIVSAPPRRVFFDKGKLISPTYIPKEVAIIKEAPLPSDSGLEGVIGGVPGGVPGGTYGGVLGGVIGGIRTNVAPPEPTKKAPIRVGGRVKEPRPVYNPPPEYPVIAKSARVQGVVVIRAILDERGNVTEMSIVSGPPLLYKAALDAVAKWKYQPTYLNDEPISVEMNIIVTFQLNQ
jgi:protein TonB